MDRTVPGRIPITRRDLLVGEFGVEPQDEDLALPVGQAPQGLDDFLALRTAQHDRLRGRGGRRIG